MSNDDALLLSIDPETKRRIADTLAEDRADCDYSTLWTIPESATAVAILIACEAGVFCGGPLFREVFLQLDPKARVKLLVEEGEPITPDQIVAEVHASARAVLSAERTALNLVGRFTGISTETHRYVEAVQGTRAVVSDTRKTMPLWRYWDKYAVRIGGGVNHRKNLAEMVLLKDNHLALVGGSLNALKLLKKHRIPGIQIEIEIERLSDLEPLLEEGGVDRILLDNMSLSEMRQAVEINRGRAILEASGGVHFGNVHAIAETGVDIISIGALTHSTKWFDFSLEIEVSLQETVK